MCGSVHKMHTLLLYVNMLDAVVNVMWFYSSSLFLFRLDDAFVDNIILFEHVDDKIIGAMICW